MVKISDRLDVDSDIRVREKPALTQFTFTFKKNCNHKEIVSVIVIVIVTTTVIISDRLDVDSDGSTVRDKREGFVDLDSLPHAMRGFANNIGKGFNSMVQHGNSLGQKLVFKVTSSFT